MCGSANICVRQQPSIGRTIERPLSTFFVLHHLCSHRTLAGRARANSFHPLIMSIQHDNSKHLLASPPTKTHPKTATCSPSTLANPIDLPRNFALNTTRICGFNYPSSEPMQNFAGNYLPFSSFRPRLTSTQPAAPPIPNCQTPVSITAQPATPSLPSKNAYASAWT